MDPRSLIADQLKRDPEFEKVKKRMVELVGSYSEKLEGPRPSDPERAVAYEEVLEAFASCRGGKMWYPYLGSGIGRGALVELIDGSVKYDMISGIGPNVFGHSHPLVMDACLEAACKDVVMQGHLQPNREAYELCQLLVEVSKKDHCFITTSGVMAVENGLKVAFQKNAPASRVLAFERCFAGRTLAVANITDKPLYRVGLPSLLHVDYVPFFDVNDPNGSTERTLTVLRKHLKRYPGQYAAMVVELVQGEAGFYTAPREFFVSLMELLKEANVAVLVDEVQTFGRTEELFAFQMLQLEKYVDIIAVGKVLDVCATLFDAAYCPKPGLLAQTFIGSSSSIMAAHAIVTELTRGNYYGKEGKIVKIHNSFARHLSALAKRCSDKVAGPFGIGAMVAFTPFGGDKELILPFVSRLFEKGVIAFIAGSDPMRVRFLPPAVVMEEGDVEAVMQIVEEVLLS